MPVPMRERRREPRFPLAQSVQITVLTPSLPLLSGTLLEVSDHGLRLQTEQPLPVSVPLQIRAGDYLLLGEAVFCAFQEGAFRAGLRIEQQLGPLTGLADWHRPIAWTPEYALAS